MRHEQQPVIEYASPRPKRPSRVDRALTFILGWLFGVMGFLLLMAPVHRLFGRIQASGTSMTAAASLGLLFAPDRRRIRPAVEPRAPTADVGAAPCPPAPLA